MLPELLPFRLRYLHADEHAADVRAVVPVVEERDVQLRRQPFRGRRRFFRGLRKVCVRAAGLAARAACCTTEIASLALRDIKFGYKKKKVST